MEYVKDKFLEGLAVAFGVAGAVRKKIVGYLYNGVQLPALPEWDRVTYPYAVIKDGYFGIGELLLVFKSIQYNDDDSSNRLLSLIAGDYKKFTAKSDGTAWYEGDATEDLNAAISRLIWSNFDILNNDNSVYLAESNPVPIYE